MSEKSFVTMVDKICIVTGKQFHANELMMDLRLKDSLEKHTLAGYGISPEVQEKIDDDYIALIGFDSSKSHPNPKQYSDFYRTGEIAYLKSNVFQDIFTVELPKEKFTFVEKEVISHLQTLQHEEV